MSEKLSSKTYVIGQQLANARLQEQARLKAENLSPSPVPHGEYETRAGELGLLNPAPSDLDVEIRKACRIFSGLSETERAKFTAAISMDEFYKLMAFTKRASVFALRAKDADLLQDAVFALAMVEAKRTDFRDIIWALAFLHHTAKRIGLDADALVYKTSQLAEPETAKLFTDFVSSGARNKNLQDWCPFTEVKTEFGQGFVGWGYKSYAPRTDLLYIAVRIASIIETDSYPHAGIQLATDLPVVWLKNPDPEPVRQALSKVLGGAMISAGFRADNQAGGHFLMVFLVEIDSAETANVLLSLSRAKKPKNYSMLGIAVGSIFCLVVGHSLVQGVDPFEKGESLNRFQRSFEEAINQREVPRILSGQ